jgi:hypothetical protein
MEKYSYNPKKSEPHPGSSLQNPAPPEMDVSAIEPGIPIP